MEQLGPVHNIDVLLAYEILDPMNNPDFVVDITNEYDYKIKALSVYHSQLDFLNDIHSYIDGMTKVRGYSISSKRGEAFKRLGKLPIKLWII